MAKKPSKPAGASASPAPRRRSSTVYVGYTAAALIVVAAVALGGWGGGGGGGGASVGALDPTAAAPTPAKARAERSPPSRKKKEQTSAQQLVSILNAASPSTGHRMAEARELARAEDVDVNMVLDTTTGENVPLSQLAFKAWTRTKSPDGVELVKELLARGANPDARASPAFNGGMPLLWQALQAEAPQLVRALLEAGAAIVPFIGPPRGNTNQGLSLLSVLFEYGKNLRKFTQLLFAINARARDEGPFASVDALLAEMRVVFVEAHAVYNESDAFKRLLSNLDAHGGEDGAAADASARRIDYYNLVDAARVHQEHGVATLRALVDRGVNVSNIALVDADGHNPLHYAAILGTDLMLLSLVEYMEDAIALEKKADAANAKLPALLQLALTTQDVLGRTPLHHAAMRTGMDARKVQTLAGLFKLAELSVGGQVLASKGIPPIVTFLETIPKDKFGKAWRDYYASTAPAKRLPKAKRPPPPAPYTAELSGGWGVSAPESRAAAAAARHALAPPEHCDIAQVLDEPSPVNFQQYLSANQPVVFRGGARGAALAGLRERWRKEPFLEQFGSRQVDVAALPKALAEVMGAAAPTSTTVRALAREMARASAAADAADGDAADDGAPPPAFHAAADLVKAQKGLLTDAERRPDFIAEVPGVPDAKVTEFAVALHLGPPGAGEPVHFARPTVDTLVYGRKRWVLLPPSDALFSSKPIARWFAEDYPYYRELKQNENITMLEFTQEPGDVVFVPDAWARGAVLLEESVGVQHEFDYHPNEVHLRLSVGQAPPR